MARSYTGPEIRGQAHLSVGLRRILPAPVILLIGFFLFTALFGGSAAAQTFINPHGGFSSSTQLCEICHAPHEAPGSKLVRGTPEAALCFTCHNGTGSNFNVEIQMNLNPATSSMHPIHVNLANNSGSYSYTINTTTAGVAPPGPYECSQCHNPHGDKGFGRLLRNRYDTSAYVAYGDPPDPYTACWTCHNASSVVNDTTYFNRHRSHIVNNQAPCTACHYSPHGIAASELVRFNPFFVTSSVAANAGPAFMDGGNHTGTCTLTCHGVDHNNLSY